MNDLLPEDNVAEHGGGVGLHAEEDVLVDGHGERRAAVAKALAHDLHRHAGLQQDRGMRVPQSWKRVRFTSDRLTRRSNIVRITSG